MRRKIEARIKASASEDGFTLVEVLIVTMIIAILLSVPVVSYVVFKNRGKDAVAQANLRAALPSINAYFADEGSYAGMTVEVLRENYDRRLPASVRIFVPESDPATYCIDSTVGNRSWRKQGPQAELEGGNQARC